MGDQPQNDNVLLVTIEATQRALAEQTTRAILNRARAYARARVRLLRACGRVTSRSTARELVHDAYTDTWAGFETWDAAECSLLVHLRRLILKRTWLEIDRAKRISFVPIKPANSNVALQLERVLADAASSEVDPAELRSFLASVCEQLAVQGTNDHETALLACWAAGQFERAEIVAVTGFDHTIYDRTRKRLMYKARHLSTDLCVVARDLLRSAS